jgi:hypothetical protein
MKKLLCWGAGAILPTQLDTGATEGVGSGPPKFRMSFEVRQNYILKPLLSWVYRRMDIKPYSCALEQR